jgi:hypothetical protein
LAERLDRPVGARPILGPIRLDRRELLLPDRELFRRQGNNLVIGELDNRRAGALRLCGKVLGGLKGNSLARVIVERLRRPTT